MSISHRRSIGLPATDLSGLEVHHEGPDGSIELRSARQVLQAWGVPEAARPMEVRMILVVEPILRLIREGVWHTILVPSSRDELPGGNLAAQWGLQFPTQSTCGASDYAGLFGTLQNVRCYLSANGDPHAIQLTRCLNEVIDALQGSPLKLASHMHEYQKHQGSGTSWTAEAYFVLALLVQNLRSSDRRDVRDVLQLCAHALFPGAMAAEIVDSQSGKACLPSSSRQVSQACLALDIAYMLQWRQWHSKYKLAYYWMADSSPLNGYDWLNSSFTYAREDKLCEIMYAVRALQAPCSPAEIGRHSRFLLEQIHDHQLAPTVLGRGASSIEHKAAAVMWSVYLEAGDHDAMRRVFGQIRSWTTDMGTELGLNDYTSADVRSLLSPPLLADELEIDPVGHRRHAESEASHDEQLSPDGHPLGRDQEVAVAIPVIEEDSRYVFPRSIGIAGMMHVLHNALSDATQALQMWDQKQPQIRKVTAFFSAKGLRERFVKCCCSGEKQKYAFLFKLGPPEFINWRWGSLMQWCAWLIPRWKAIQICWNKEVFEHKSEEGWETSDKESLNVRELNQLLRDVELYAFHVVLQNSGAGVTCLRTWMHTCPCHEALKINSTHKQSTHTQPTQNTQGALGECCT